MRREFSSWIEEFGRSEERFLFLTGDLGFAAFENVAAALGRRFINMGVSEQNMVSVAAGLAHQGLMPLCYSIAPFAVFRPYEQIRLDVALHNLNVKIVGNGGGYGYGIMGASHHALEDLAVLSCLPNFLCIVPLCNTDVSGACDEVFRRHGPTYLRLGLGQWPEKAGDLPSFAPVRKIVAATGSPLVTIAGIGPTLLNVFPWILDDSDADVFAISQLPLFDSWEELAQSVKESQSLWVVEEHSARGGLGECLSTALVKEGLSFQLHHSHAQGYPNGLYGTQSYHQKLSGLDSKSLQGTYNSITVRPVWQSSE